MKYPYHRFIKWLFRRYFAEIDKEAGKKRLNAIKTKKPFRSKKAVRWVVNTIKNEYPLLYAPDEKDIVIPEELRGGLTPSKDALAILNNLQVRKVVELCTMGGIAADKTADYAGTLVSSGVKITEKGVTQYVKTFWDWHSLTWAEQNNFLIRVSGWNRRDIALSPTEDGVVSAGYYDFHIKMFWGDYDIGHVLSAVGIMPEEEMHKRTLERGMVIASKNFLDSAIHGHAPIAYAWSNAIKNISQVLEKMGGAGKSPIESLAAYLLMQLDSDQADAEYDDEDVTPEQLYGDQWNEIRDRRD